MQINRVLEIPQEYLENELDAAAAEASLYLFLLADRFGPGAYVGLIPFGLMNKKDMFLWIKLLDLNLRRIAAWREKGEEFMRALCADYTLYAKVKEPSHKAFAEHFGFVPYKSEKDLLWR